ncbi:hypothetical protein Kpol_1042p27 [Vanderwaltozyma polyspora DSM 70294]|uniref:Maintenance of telomere capping protein 2 n=1 Tax=Vanderwaltozyma polyspora (strain ATCC 22028 / DSM 70294 / BCRC 21397 / CBS 2163 / NBRC 10782 / NRRL Y-8283 / UCD 57-17) TaxID=436907 RepID=MTC2_VANPO|nr:uncharacterized protein Kpol_1042p27 [Vanderwaltozyma polyspora DSM 70294]A7TQB2.1 RecName: Full=Maintenance of telomere capping protein 2 [Vanderwaltozyma polyspora DSM 70294]EDO15566.1 hypothetical protein Kpol_1042p27 [Vanderwaltozyma polyspora DSM 70294]
MKYNEELMDFEMALRFSVVTNKSFICFVNKEIEVTPQVVVKQAVERILSDLDGLEIEVLDSFLDTKCNNKTKSEDCKIKITIVPNLNNLTAEKQNVLSKYLRDNSNDIQGPRVKRNPKFQTTDLTNDKTEKNNTKYIVIGIVLYENKNEDENEDEEERLDKKSNVLTINDWLRNKFWLGCMAPVDESIEIVESIIYSMKDLEKYDTVVIKPVIKRYIEDIIVHLRMHNITYKPKGGGIQPDALHDIVALSQLISIMSSKYNKQLWFVTPDYIKIASMFYFPSHLRIVSDSSMDVSVAYGSKSHLVDEFLEKLNKVKFLARSQNPLFIESLVVKDVLTKIIPAI